MHVHARPDDRQYAQQNTNNRKGYRLSLVRHHLRQPPMHISYAAQPVQVDEVVDFPQQLPVQLLALQSDVLDGVP